MEEHRPKKLLHQSLPVLSLAKGCHSLQTLFLSHGAGLRGLDQAVLAENAHPFEDRVQEPQVMV